MSVLAALLHAVVDLGDAHLRLNVVDPVVMANVGRGRACQAQDRCSQTAGDDGGKSELLHCSVLLLSARVVARRSRFGRSWCRRGILLPGLMGVTGQVRRLIPMAVIG